MAEKSDDRSADALDSVFKYLTSPKFRLVSEEIARTGDAVLVLMKSSKMALLRIQLFTAMQQLEGEDLAEFWKLIDDVNACRKEEF
jgi:hypothetical protein